VPQSGANFRFLSLVFVCIVIINVDAYTKTLAPVRALLGLLVQPVQELVLVPGRFSGWISSRAISEPELQLAFETTYEENQILKLRLQKLTGLVAENGRLRQLLSASRNGLDAVMMAELESVSLEPFTQQITINKGLAEKVYEGQPVLDVYGVVGQVIRPSYFKSSVSLVTDPGQSVPVMVARNGLRAVIFGGGQHNRILVPYLERNTDIRKDDLLITSGMGGRFPYGYPVARVTEVAVDVNEPFLSVIAAPVARLNHSREVLLVWPGDLPIVEPQPAAQTETNAEASDVTGQ
jgi:rod shape-determining protein MreC